MDERATAKSPDTRLLNLNDVICDLQPLISHHLGNASSLTTNLGSAVGLIRADRNRLREMLLHVAFTAQDGMRPRAELCLETSAVEVHPGSHVARVCAPGPYVRLCVKDNGPVVARIDTIYGRRLSVVHNIVRESGGHVSVTSKAGEGASVEILLPSSRPDLIVIA